MRSRPNTRPGMQVGGLHPLQFVADIHVQKIAKGKMGAAIVQLIRLPLPSCGSGFESRAQH